MKKVLLLVPLLFLVGCGSSKLEEYSILDCKNKGGIAYDNGVCEITKYQMLNFPEEALNCVKNGGDYMLYYEKGWLRFKQKCTIPEISTRIEIDLYTITSTHEIKVE